MPFTSGSTSYKSTCHGNKDSTVSIPSSFCLTSYPAKNQTHSRLDSSGWAACAASLVLGEHLGAGQLPPLLGPVLSGGRVSSPAYEPSNVVAKPECSLSASLSLLKFPKVDKVALSLGCFCAAAFSSPAK